MQIIETVSLPRAKALIQHARAVDFDEKTGLWQYKIIDEQESHNLILDGGRVAIHTYVYGTSAQRTAAGLSGTGFNYIALTNDSGAPAAGDTTLTGELTTDGLGRAVGTVTLPTGSGNQTTVAKTFTYTGGTSQAVQKTALFDASSAGKMAHELTFTQRTLFPSDTLTVTFTITLG